MGMLDFIKNRGQSASIPANDRGMAAPETAKQMHTREAVEEKASQPPVSRLSAEQLAEVRAIGAEIQPPTTPPPPPSPTPAPADAPTGADSQQPMKQVAMGQENAAPDLSPSSAQMGVKEADLPVRPTDTPKPTVAPAKPSRSMSPDF